MFTQETAQRQGRMKSAVHRAVSLSKLLIVDDPKAARSSRISYLPLAGDQANLFFQVVAKRYERRAIILTVLEGQRRGRAGMPRHSRRAMRRA